MRTKEIKELGLNIAIARESKGLTQRQLAELIGVDRGTIGRWEAGIETPPISRLKDLCLTLNVSADVLLDLELSPA